MNSVMVGNRLRRILLERALDRGDEAERQLGPLFEQAR